MLLCQWQRWLTHSRSQSQDRGQGGHDHRLAAVRLEVQRQLAVVFPQANVCRSGCGQCEGREECEHEHAVKRDQSVLGHGSLFSLDRPATGWCRAPLSLAGAQRSRIALKVPEIYDVPLPCASLACGSSGAAAGSFPQLFRSAPAGASEQPSALSLCRLRGTLRNSRTDWCRGCLSIARNFSQQLRKVRSREARVEKKSRERISPRPGELIVRTAK